MKPKREVWYHPNEMAGLGPVGVREHPTDPDLVVMRRDDQVAVFEAAGYKKDEP